MPSIPTRSAHDRPVGHRHPEPSPVGALALRLAAVAAGLGVVVGVVVALFAGVLAGVGVAVLVAVVAGAVPWFTLVSPRLRSAEARVLGLVGATRPADVRADARYLNLVEGLAPGAGLPRPECLVIDDPSVNALALGRDARHGVVVMTTGMLDRLSRMELEAVVGRALVELRDGTTAGPTVALALGRPVTADEVAALAADLQAVALTRYPPGLSAALRSVLAARQEGAADVPPGASPALQSRWFAPPGGNDELERRAGALDEV